MKNKKVLGTLVALAFLGTTGCCTLKNKTLYDYDVKGTVGKAKVKYELVNSPLQYKSFDPDYKLTITGEFYEWVIIDNNRDGRINLEGNDYVIAKSYDEFHKLIRTEKFNRSNPDLKAMEFADAAYVYILDDIRDKLPEGEKDKIPKPNTH